MRQSRAKYLQIRTPEGIVFSLHLAGPMTRFLAWVIDIFILSALSKILQTLVVGILGLFSKDLAGGVFTVTYFILSTGYGIFLEWRWQGQTIGKRLMRLRVMDENGLRLQFNQVVIRNLLRFIDRLPLFYVVGGVAALVTRHSQRLGDIAANTIVIRQPRLSEPDLDQLLPDKYNSFHDYPHIEARLRGRVSPDEAGIALRALMRRDSFDPGARIELFSHIADHFRSLAEFPEEAVQGLSDEQYVRNIVDVLFQSRGKF